MIHRTLGLRSVLAVATALSCCLYSLAYSGTLDEAINAVVDKNKKSALAQKKIDELSLDTKVLLEEFRSHQESIDSLRKYNEQLQTLIQSQEQDMVSLKEQISQVTVVGRELTPLMLRMLDSIDRFVELDVPFLLAERKERVANLKAMMSRADVTTAEKFRRLLEAYQVENDYGRTIESYKGALRNGDKSRTVNFLRVGRVTLLYQTLDGVECGLWDQEKRAWVVLPNEYRTAVSKGLRIARKQAPPDLIRLPVPSATEARQ